MLKHCFVFQNYILLIQNENLDLQLSQNTCQLWLCVRGGWRSCTGSSPNTGLEDQLQVDNDEEWCWTLDKSSWEKLSVHSFPVLEFIHVRHLIPTSAELLVLDSVQI